MSHECSSVMWSRSVRPTSAVRPAAPAQRGSIATRADAARIELQEFTRDEVWDYAKAAGFKIIIAGAGGAAHLPGMLAAKTAVVILFDILRDGFIRFTGEWFIYVVLMALGGGVLTVQPAQAHGLKRQAARGLMIPTYANARTNAIVPPLAPSSAT